MATIYICKCGRQVRKSTNADNTGNRDTAGCRGCPYLLPWGPTQWDATRHAMVTDVKGYECRMSPSLDYATYYQGGGEDKCVLHIYSLDYDFLDRVTAWAAKQFPDEEISCSFDRSKIRATDFVGGLYGMSVYPMQNKKGMAAKAALIERFFGPDRHRLDKTPEEEKAIVLAAIEAGKAKAQERKENMDYIISKHEATGRLYAYYKGSFWFWDSHVQRWLLSQFAEDLYQEERPKRRNFEREHFLAQTSDFHQLDDYEVPSRCIEALLQCNPKTAKTAEKENPTSSAAATAAAEETAATPEPSDSASMTAAPVAKASEPAGVASENVLAGADGSTAFDYSGLDDQTVADLHLAEQEYSSGKKMAEMGLRRMADAVAIAHDALCITDATICRTGGKFASPEQSFSSWCESMGLNRKAAERLLQVSKLMDDSSPREQKVLEELSPSLLYAAAKPSAPAELVQAVKDGDITTHKQFKELEAQLKAEREARVKAQQDLETVERARDAEHEANSALLADEQRRRQAADEARIAAEKKVQQYREIKDAALENVKMEQEKAVNAELRARAAEAEVKSWEADGQKMQEIVDDQQAVIEEQKIRIGELESGITVETTAADQEEIERRANELSEPLVKIIDQQNEQIERMASGNTVAAQASVLEQYLETMKASLLGNAHRTELACYDVGALDSLAQALREFADEIDRLFEEGEEGEENEDQQGEA